MAPWRRSGRQWLLSSLVLVLVAALTATTVVALRRPESSPAAAAQPLQVGIEAPSLAVEGDSVPVLVSAIGQESLVLVELWVNGAAVQSIAPSQEDQVSLTLHWPASGPGVASAHARVVDAAGGVGISNTAFIRVAPTPLAVIVDDPAGSTISEIAMEQGIDPDAVAAINPGADPGERLSPGSVVFLPHLDPGSAPPSDRAQVSIEGTVLHLTEPVDGVFLYLAFGGEVYRLPEDPAQLIPGSGVLFDLAPFLPPLPDGDVGVEVWGRTGGEVILLESLVVPSSVLVGPATDLVALWDLPLFGTSIPVNSLTATDAETVELEWSSNVAHSAVRWFLATVKPGAATALTPAGLMQSGLAEPDDGLRRFSIDLSVDAPPRLTPAPISLLPIALVPGEISVDAGAGTRTLPPLGPPGTTWAWVIPVDSAGEPVGPPSEPVRIVVTEAPFDPTIAPPFDVVSIEVVIPPAPNFALADCVRILSQTPPFPAGVGLGFYLGPDGSVQYKGGGGTKITGALPYILDESGRALYPFTACPGERGNFQWGSVGCGADPLCHISTGLADLGAAAVAFGEFLVGLANELSDAYNELKAWAIDQVASVICPEEVAGACKTMINIAVDALLTTVGVPPTMPNFDDLADVAKGELVDLAMDQLGVGTACDALAQAGTGKTCGELATQLENLDACSFAPEGQEDNCRGLVEQAKEACDLAAQSPQCELLTKNAQNLLEEGIEIAVDESIDAIEEQVTKAALGSLGFYPQSLWGYYQGQTGEHHCQWGGENNDQVICPPWSPDNDQSPFPFPFGGADEIPPGCHIGTFGQDDGRVVCSFPPGEIVAIPEPLGQRQPIEVKVILARNDNPLPDDFACGPISAVATTITPFGAIGKPYIPASTEFPYKSLFLIPDLYTATMFLSEPNPHVQVPDENQPPPPTGVIADVIEAVAEGVDGFGLASNEWRYLLEPGSFVGITVYGACIPLTHADGPFGVAGVIPTPQPRITPGAP